MLSILIFFALQNVLTKNQQKMSMIR